MTSAITSISSDISAAYTALDTANKNGWLHSGIMQTSQDLVDTNEFKAKFYEKIEQLRPQLKKMQLKKTIRELTQ